MYWTISNSLHKKYLCLSNLRTLASTYKKQNHNLLIYKTELNLYMHIIALYQKNKHIWKLNATFPQAATDHRFSGLPFFLLIYNNWHACFEKKIPLFFYCLLHNTELCSFAAKENKRIHTALLFKLYQDRKRRIHYFCNCINAKRTETFSAGTNSNIRFNFSCSFIPAEILTLRLAKNSQLYRSYQNFDDPIWAESVELRVIVTVMDYHC